jgi:peptide/nickel transport system substrate-binding protein
VNSKLFLLVAVLGFFLCSCGNSSFSEKEASALNVQSSSSFALPNSAWDSSWAADHRLQIAMPSIPSNLNPFTNLTSTGQAIQRQLHGFLWKTNPKTGIPEAELCAALSALPNQKNNWQINLHQNRFFDPTKPESRCISADVAFTLKAFSMPGLAHAGFQNALQALKQVWLTNDSTLQLEFWGSDSALIYALSDLPILREAEWNPSKSLRSFSQTSAFTSVADYSDLVKAGQKNTPRQGLGNYSLLEFEPSQRVRMCRKANSKLPIMAPDTLDWIWLGDATGLENHLKYQRADVFPYLTHSDMLAFNRNPSIKAHYHLSAIKTETFTFLAFNTKPAETAQHPALADPQLRMALAYLTPKQKLLSVLFDSSLKPIEGLGHLGPKKIKPGPNFQPEKAKAFLKKAGWNDSDGNGILDKIHNGQFVELKLTLLYNAASRISEDLASLLQGHWMVAGVGLEKKALAAAAFFTEAENHNYDVILTGFAGKYSPAHMHELWHSQSWKNRGHNYTGFGNAYSDELLLQLNSTINPVKQEELLLKLQDLILEKTPWIPLYYSQRYMATHRRWHGVHVLSLPPGFMPEEFRLGKGN